VSCQQKKPCIYKHVHLDSYFCIWINKGYGKKYFQDIYRQSNQVFLSKEPFTKYTEDKSKRSVQSCPVEAYGYRRRYPKRHTPRLLNANDHANEIYSYNKGPSISTYLEKKENTTLPHNSLNFESEMFLVRKKKKDLFASEGFKHSFVHPWKYSYTKNDYQTCTEPFRRVRSSNIDLSKY